LFGEIVTVADYRAYIMDRMATCRTALICFAPMMTEAIRLAKQLVDGHDVELWQLDRKIDTFKHRPRIGGERGAGMAFHRGGGSGWHDFRCDDGPCFFGFEPLQSAGLDDLDCRFFCQSKLSGAIRRSTTPDTPNQIFLVPKLLCAQTAVADGGLLSALSILEYNCDRPGIRVGLFVIPVLISPFTCLTSSVGIMMAFQTISNHPHCHVQLSRIVHLSVSFFWPAGVAHDGSTTSEWHQAGADYTPRQQVESARRERDYP
jgi:hypothetical protein